MADAIERHARHDVEVVAAYAVGEASGADLERAERLLDDCHLCVDVARDIRAITLGLQSMPAVGALAALPSAPRDFRLTPETAARLRPSSPLVRWADRLGAGVAAFGRPVGATLATLGVVGLLVGSMSFGALGGAASAPFQAAAGAAGATAAAAGNLAAGEQPTATKTADGITAFGPAVTAAPEVDSGTPRARNAAAIVNPATWLLGGSVLILVVGLGLIVIATRRGSRSRG